MTSFSHVKEYVFGFECRLTHGGPIYIRFAPIDSVQLAAYLGLEIWVKKSRLEPNSGCRHFPMLKYRDLVSSGVDPWWADLQPVCASGLSSISGKLWTRNLGEKVATGTE